MAVCVEARGSQWKWIRMEVNEKHSRWKTVDVNMEVLTR